MLGIDLESVPNYYEEGEIQDISYITLKYSIADNLKRIKKQIILVQSIEQARLDHLLQH